MYIKELLYGKMTLLYMPSRWHHSPIEKLPLAIFSLKNTKRPNQVNLLTLLSILY